MLKRGVKRKVSSAARSASATASSSSSSSSSSKSKRSSSADPAEFSAEDYARNLSNFQIATRRRESMRLKHQVAAAPGLVERHLKEKVAIEMSLVEGTAKFIMACRNHSQTLEAAKTLLVARLRADMLKFELNKMRRGRGSPQMKPGKPSYASLSVSELRIPLMWRRKDHIQDVGDGRRFAVFCVARIGSQIYESSLVEPVDRQATGHHAARRARLQQGEDNLADRVNPVSHPRRMYSCRCRPTSR